MEELERKKIKKITLFIIGFLIMIGLSPLIFTSFNGGVAGTYKNMPDDNFSYILKSDGSYDITYDGNITKSGKWHKEGNKITIGEQTFDYKNNSFCEFSFVKNDEVCYEKQ